MFSRKAKLRSKTNITGHKTFRKEKRERERVSCPSIPSKLSSSTLTVSSLCVISEKTNYDLVRKQTCSVGSQHRKTKTIPLNEDTNSISQISQ